MAEPKKSEAPPTPEKYEEIVQKLQGIVERLEGGGLSLEESVAAFEQGIGLARAGARKLDEAEKRVEILLDGDRVQPFDPARPDAPAPRAASRAGKPPDGDIPF